MILNKLGWNNFFENFLDNETGINNYPARVISVRKNSFMVSNGREEFLATISGSLLHETEKGALYPATGDWVLLKETMITKVLPRKNALTRGASGTRGSSTEAPVKEQIIAANINTVFIVCGLDQDFNMRRIERYITLVYNCDSNPVIILTKCDLHEDTEEFVKDVESIAFGIPVHAVSSIESKGVEILKKYLEPGQTVALIGSSGAGKSTLLNNIADKKLREVREVSSSDGKGVHTTTSRDLFTLPEGGMIIDNPGIREIAFWDDDGGIDSAFPEIEALGKMCRFSDCSHILEPGCSVIKAVESGELTEERLKSYLKMRRELDYVNERQVKSADRIEKDKWKDIKKSYKNRNKKIL